MNTPQKSWSWKNIAHPERAFWGLPERLPWPDEASDKPDPHVMFPAGDMREGIRRLHRSAPGEWNDTWARLQKFCDTGDSIGDALEHGDLRGAIEQIRALESFRPGTAYCPFNTAALLKALGDTAGARASYILATERGPDIEWLWMRRGELHEELKEKDEATACYRKALALLPKHREAILGLCRLGHFAILTVTNPDGTKEDRVVERAVFNRRVIADLQQTPPAEPHLRESLRQFLESGDGELALTAAERILSGNPPDRTALTIQRADALRLCKRYEEAEDLLDEILTAEENAAACYVHAWCAFDQKWGDTGWQYIEDTLAADPNHQQAIQVKFGIGTGQKDPAGAVAKCTAWAEENHSWRACYCAAMQCATSGDKAGTLRWSEAAYRMAPHERDALFFYANSLNNAGEGEHTAALLHPRLPETKGDYLLKYIFAGAMHKLGLKDEAIRILRLALEESAAAPRGTAIAVKGDIRGMITTFLDMLLGHTAKGDIKAELIPGTDTLSRGLWHATDAGPTSSLAQGGIPLPLDRHFDMAPPEGYTGDTATLSFSLHSEASTQTPLTLGWWRIGDLDYTTPGHPLPRFHLTIAKDGTLTGRAYQNDRPLPITWSLYRTPSLDQEKKRD